MTWVWQRFHASCGSTRLQRPDAGHSAVLSDEQRREARIAKRQPCEFALTHASKPDGVLIEEGTGVTVNMSRSGMQLLLGLAPRTGQLLEVHVGGKVQRSVSLVEVRWTKAVREDSQGQLHLVGCRLTFGPSRYWAI